jgi:hypothetical protein
MANTPISPKVIAGANAAGYATLVLTLLDSLAPDSFAFLGKLQPLAYGIVIAGSFALRAFLKADPLREAGAAALAAAEALTAAASPASDTPPVPQSAPVAPVANVPAAAPAVSFASTQAKIDGLPDVPAPVAPVFEAPAEAVPPVA